MSSPDGSDKTTEAKFNMGISKLQRIHDKIAYAHNVAVDDVQHGHWKRALDCVYRELYSYICEGVEDKKLLSRIDDAKKKCRDNLITYLRFLGTVKLDVLSGHVRELKQEKLEQALEDYETLLFVALRLKGMDMPDKDSDAFEDLE